MIIGHLSYHPFMLVPGLAFLLLRTIPESPQWRLHMAYDIVGAGLCMAYMVYAGMVNGALPALASVAVIGLLHSVIQQQSSMFWRRLLLSGCLALCSAKLVAAMAYLHYFGRDAYRLPGAQSLFEIAALIVRSLFLGPAVQLVAEVFVNRQWTVARHELEYGVTCVPLLLLLMGGVAGVYREREWEGQGQPKLWLSAGGAYGSPAPTNRSELLHSAVKYDLKTHPDSQEQLPPDPLGQPLYPCGYSTGRGGARSHGEPATLSIPCGHPQSCRGCTAE